MNNIDEIKKSNKGRKKGKERAEYNEIGVLKTLVEQIYNPFNKMNYLNDCVKTESTRNSRAVYFVKCSKMEKEFKKDVCDFSRDELLDLFSEEFSDSLALLTVYYSTLKKYTAWCCVRGISRTKLNQFDFLNFNQDIAPMYNMRGLKGKIITEDQMWNMIDLDKVQNKQDHVGLALPFYGVKGNQNEEMLQLKMSDINKETGETNLTDLVKLKTVDEVDENGIKYKKVIERVQKQRKTTLPHKLINLIEEASKELNYKREKARVSDENREKGEDMAIMPLVINDYVIRPIVLKRQDSELMEAREKKGLPIREDNVAKQLIGSRVKRMLANLSDMNITQATIGNNTGLEKINFKEISLMDIYNSGKIHQCRLLHEVKGEDLIYTDYSYVNAMFGDSEANIGNLRSLYESILKLEQEDKERKIREQEQAKRNNMGR